MEREEGRSRRGAGPLIAVLRLLALLSTVPAKARWIG